VLDHDRLSRDDLLGSVTFTPAELKKISADFQVCLLVCVCVCMFIFVCACFTLCISSSIVIFMISLLLLAVKQIALGCHGKRVIVPLCNILSCTVQSVNQSINQSKVTYTASDQWLAKMLQSC